MSRPNPSIVLAAAFAIALVSPVSGQEAAEDDWGPVPEKPQAPVAVEEPVAEAPAAAPATGARAEIGKTPGGIGMSGTASAPPDTAATPATAPATESVAAGDPEMSPLVADCDRLAAHPNNAANPAGIGGVDFSDIDAKAAVAACEAAVEAFPGHGRSVYNLGRAYDASSDFKRALGEYERATALGEPWGDYGIGMIYREVASLGHSDAEAIPHFRSAAEMGVTDAAFELGWSYERGLGLAQDYDQAAYWYQRAADDGHLLATNNLGWLYAEGLGVARDDVRAVALYRTAAEAGLPLGMTNYAWMLHNGIGVAQDEKNAVIWYRSAAMQGETMAMLDLGSIYLWGTGVERDPDQALDWFRKAEEAGDTDALSYIGELYEAAEEYYDPDQAAWYYIRALKAGNDWPAGRMAGEWDTDTARALQQILKDVGVYTGAVDGVAGPGTRAAMEKLLPAGD